LDSYSDPDRHQYLMHCFFIRRQTFPVISLNFIHNFLCYDAHGQTDVEKQTNREEYII